jgi:hypothetical protein
MVALVRMTNRALDRDGDLSGVAEVLANAPSVLDAARSAGLLDGGGVDADHAADVLAKLPPAVDAALLATLRNAAERGVGAVVQWKPGADVELGVWEAVDGDVGHVGVLLVSPPGRKLAASG